jgi:hypothetical protein
MGCLLVGDVGRSRGGSDSDSMISRTDAADDKREGT